MADLSKTIEIIFQGKDNVSTVVSALGSDLSKLSSSVVDITAPFADMTHSLQIAEAGILGVGAAAIGFAVGDAVSFEAALADLQKVMGEGEGNASDYIEKIQALALKTGESSIAVTEAVSNWKQAGWTMEDIFGKDGGMGLAESGLVAVKISSLEAGDAANMFKQILAGLGAPASEIGRVLDTLNGISNNFNATFEELGIAMRDLSPAANTAGYSIEELGAIVTPVIAVMGSGAEVATAMNFIFSKLAVETKPVADGLHAIGVEMTDSNGTLKSANTILDEVAGKWTTLSAEEQGEIAVLLAGKNHRLAMLALMNDYDTALKAETAETIKAGNAMDEFNTRMKTVTAHVDIAKVAFENLSISVGLKFTGEALGGADALTLFFVAMKKVVDEGSLDKFFDGLRPMWDELIKFIETVARNLPEAFKGIDYSELIRELTALKDKVIELFKALFGDYDLNTVKGLHDFLQNLVNQLSNLTAFNVGAFDGLIQMAEGIEKISKAIDGMSIEDIEAIGKGFGALTELHTIAGYVGEFTKVIEGLGAAMGVILAPTFLTSLSKLAAQVAGGAAGTGFAASVALAAPATVTWTTAILGLSAAWAGWELGKYINDVMGWNTEVDKSAGTTERSAAAAERAAAILKQFGQVVGDDTPTMEEFKKAVDAGTVVFDKATGSWQLSATAAKDFGAAASGTNVEIKAYGYAMATTADDAKDLQSQLLSLASNEKIKAMEFKMRLDIAEVKANADTAIAAFSSLSKTIESTGTLLGTLYGLLANPESAYQNKILEQIRMENEARQKAIDQQTQLNQKLIDYYAAKVDALKKNDALVTIDGAGLQPHLEAFMWEILSAIQVRVNEDGLEMLVGV